MSKQRRFQEETVEVLTQVQEHMEQLATALAARHAHPEQDGPPAHIMFLASLRSQALGLALQKYGTTVYAVESEGVRATQVHDEEVVKTAQRYFDFIVRGC